MANAETVAGWVAAAWSGDRAAQGALVRRFRPTMLLVAQGACGCREAAEDAVQDAFLTAFRALANLEEPARFGPWLATIVRNRARRLAREGRCLPLGEFDAQVPEPALPSPVEEAVRALPEGIRESTVLYYLERWSVGEIAALLERPVTTVKWQLHAGRALLRKRLGVSENP